MRGANKKLNEESIVIIGQHGGSFVEPMAEEPEQDTAYAPEGIVKHIIRLDAYEARTKEIHWSCDNDKTHVLCDELRDKIVKYQDGIAEVYMGMCGTKLQLGVLCNQSCEISADTLPELCKELISELCSLVKGIDSIIEYRGIKRKCEEMIEYLDTILYKETQK